MKHNFTGLLGTGHVSSVTRVAQAMVKPRASSECESLAHPPLFFADSNAFISELRGMTADKRETALANKPTGELSQLFSAAMVAGDSDLAATIEVHANSRNQY